MVLRRNRKGITGIMDAMIFIAIMTVVFSALYAGSIHEVRDDRAADIAGNVLSSKIRACDIMNTEDSKMISMTDAMAAAVVTGNGNAISLIESILDASVGVPGSYSFAMTYNGRTVTIGDDTGTPGSGHRSETAVIFGGILITELKLY